MNKLLTYAAILCGAMTVSGLTSCSSSDDSKDTIDLLPVQTSKGGRWSMIDNKGKIVYDSEFEERPTMVIDGCFSVKDGDGYTLYKIGGKNPEVVKGCEKLNAVGIMSDGLIPIVRPEKRIEIVNKSGETEFEFSPIDSAEVTDCGTRFYNNRLHITTSNLKHGYVDRTGKCVIPCIYDFASDFEDGYAIVSKREDGNSGMETYYLIDTSGDVVFKIRSGNDVPTLFHGYVKIAKDDHFVLIDKDNEEHKLPSKVGMLWEMKDDLIIYTDEDSNHGLVNLDGEIIIRAKYASLTFASNGDLIAKKSFDSHEMLILDTRGEEKQTVDCDNIYIVDGFGYLGVESNAYTVLDENFKEVNKEEFFGHSDYKCYGNLTSDYVNREMIANELTGLILSDASGVEEGKFGQTAASLMEGEPPSDYLFRDFHVFNPAGVRMGYELRGTLVLTCSMGDSEYTENGLEYVWNPKSKIGKILLTLSCDKGWQSEGHTELVNSMKKKGFSILKEGMMLDDTGSKPVYVLTAVMKKGSVVAVVSSSYKLAWVLLISLKEYPDAEESARNVVFGKYTIGQDGSINQIEAEAMKPEGVLGFRDFASISCLR